MSCYTLTYYQCRIYHIGRRREPMARKELLQLLKMRLQILIMMPSSTAGMESSLVLPVPETFTVALVWLLAGENTHSVASSTCGPN
jgi:hypothetical protein